MIRRLLPAALAAAALLCAPEIADACPMCKAGAEADDNLPRAFFASILFMMGMPVALATGFGVAFYRLSRTPQEGVPENWPGQFDEPAAPAE